MQGSAHFHLVTLGRLALVRDDGMAEESLQKRRRKLAVLAWLAVEGRPRSRDAAVEMFWGDQEERRARHSLSDAVSHLRRVLGRGAIAADRAELAVARDAPLTVDACALTRAAARGDHAGVVALYGGPFLDGVYVEGSASFEHWAAQQRARIDAAFVRACRARCAELEREGDRDACAALAARWLDVHPLSPDAALARLRALAGSGDADGTFAALADFERLSARLMREFDAEPAHEVRELAASLRRNPRVTSAPRVDPAPTAAAAVAAATATATAIMIATSAALDAAPLPEAIAPARNDRPHPGRAHRERRRRTMLLFAMLVAILGFLGPRLRTADRGHELSLDRVAVLPFTVRAAPGSEGAAYLREGMVDLLTASLDGAGALHAADPRAVLSAVSRLGGAPLDEVHARKIAAGLGAGMFVTGDVVETGGELRVSATLHAGGERDALSRAAVSGPSDSLFAVVDRLTAELLAHRAAEPAEELQRVAAVTTPSLGALKDWLRGEEHYRNGQYAAAFESFQHAVAQDDGFSLAHYRLAKTATWAGIWSWDSIVAGSGRAVRHEDRLARRQKLLVEAFDAWMRGDADGAERRYRQVVASAPDDVEAWYELGEVLFHCNPLRGRPAAGARVALEHALALEPGHRGALVHLLRIAAMEGRDDEVDSLTRRALAVSGEDWGIELRAFRAYALRDAAGIASADSMLRTAQDAILERTAERVAIYTGDLAGAGHLARMMTGLPRTAELRMRGELWVASLAIARGQWRAAGPHFAAAERTWPKQAIMERARLMALPYAPVSAAELRATRDTLRRWDATAPASQWPSVQVYDGLYPAIREYLIGLLSVRLGDTAAASTAAISLDRIARGARAGDPAHQARAELARGLGESLRAHIALLAGDRTGALERLERARIVVPEGVLESAIGSQAHERWARAELLRESGRLRDALGWYRSIPEVGIHGLPFLAPAELRQGEVEERLGDRARAAAHYRRVLELWAHADPELQPVVREAAARLRGLGSTT